MLINLLTSRILRRTAGLNPNHTQCRGELTVGGCASNTKFVEGWLSREKKHLCFKNSNCIACSDRTSLGRVRAAKVAEHLLRAMSKQHPTHLIPSGRRFMPDVSLPVHAECPLPNAKVDEVLLRPHGVPPPRKRFRLDVKLLLRITSFYPYLPFEFDLVDLWLSVMSSYAGLSSTSIST